MPQPLRSLTHEDVASFGATCFRPALDRKVGAEIEFITVDATDPFAPVDLAAINEVVAGTSLRGRVTLEPGGQVEIVSPAAASLDEACAAITADHRTLRSALAARGMALVGSGLDPYRPERRIVRAPRYDAMEAFFDGDGLSGRIMMTRTAAIQVNLDLDEPRAQWKLAHAAGPAMAAACANSPLYCGVPSGWRSARLSTWRGIDRTRTSPVGGDGPDAWARYLLAARVMLIRRAPEDFVPVLRSMTFEEWMRDGHALGWPDADDLAYHATTIFPPVRPRRWLEIRMCDSLPDPWWQVPVAVWSAVIYDAREEAVRACVGTEDLWMEAARDGLSDPRLAAAARDLFAIALRALPAGSARDVVEAYNQRWVARARTPADDTLDAAQEFTLDRKPVTAWT